MLLFGDVINIEYHSSILWHVVYAEILLVGWFFFFFPTHYVNTLWIKKKK